MRITYAEGVGIPIENLSDEEVERLLALLEKRKALRADDDHSREDRRPAYDWVA